MAIQESTNKLWDQIWVLSQHTRNDTAMDRTKVLLSTNEIPPTQEQDTSFLSRNTSLLD